MTIAHATADALGRCAHCQQPLAGGQELFCCRGCASVYSLLRDRGLDRYYELRRGAGVPVVGEPGGDRGWLASRIEELAAATGPTRLLFDVQGLHCGACVWLIERVTAALPGSLRAEVNPSRGRIELWVEPTFPLARWVDEVEGFGYRIGPPLRAADAGADGLLVRFGVTAALAMNAMMLSAALYLGLEDGVLYRVVRVLVAALGVGAVLVGGPVFFRGAIGALRRRALHMDAPISLGIVLALAGSLWGLATGSDRALYFDSLAVFVALMLLGRLLQERTVAANRDRILASGGVDGLRCRVVRDGRVSDVACSGIQPGDELLIAPGALLPVDGALGSGAASLRLDWISGESEPQAYRSGDRVPAGAFNAGRSAVRVRSHTAMADSPLVALLGAGGERGSGSARILAAIARLYVPAVLLLAATGFIAWLATSRDVARSLEVATALLVVTCPCAFGLAIPLATDLAMSALARRGIFVRRSDFLERARAIRRVGFDKTGTLTTGELRILDPSQLAALDAAHSELLYQLVSRSGHAKSNAVRRALEEAGVAPGLRDDLDVVERTGIGLEAVDAGRTYRLGKAGWATDDGRGGEEIAYGVDGQTLAALGTEETLRDDVASEVSALREEGLETWIVSGDRPERVRRVAETSGIADDRAVGGQSPEDKAAWIAAHDCGDTLFVGDGINDSLAIDAATCSTTPAIDRPFVAARSDLYFTSPGLAPIREALAAARRHGRAVARVVTFAVGYNLAAVTVALAGWMQPWLAAVLMPASSLLIVGAAAATVTSRT